MFKKINVLIILACLAVSLSSCKGGSSEADTSTYETTLPQFTITDQRQLSFYFMGNSNEQNREVFAPILDMIEEKAAHLMIDLDFNWVEYENYVEDIMLMLASGTEIDAFSYPTIGFAGELMFDVSLLTDLTDMIPKYAPRYFSMLSEETLASDYISRDGRIYAIPNHESYDLFYKNCVVARKDLVERSGITGITTYKDYGELLRWINDNEQTVIPGMCPSFTVFEKYLIGNGYYKGKEAYVYYRWEDEIPVAYTLEQIDEFSELYLMLQEWREDELLLFRTPRDDSWQYGLCASTITSLYDLRSMIDTSNMKHDYSIFPLYPDAQTQKIGDTTFVTMISIDSPDADRILMFFDWLFSDSEAYDLLMFGVEDVNYKTSDSRIYFETGMTAIFNWDGSQAFKNSLLDKPIFLEPYGYLDVINETLSNGNVSVTPYENINIIYDSLTEEEQQACDIVFDENYNNCVDLYNEYFSMILIDMYVDNVMSIGLDELIEGLEASGGQVIRDAWNEWVDRVLDHGR